MSTSVPLLTTANYSLWEPAIKDYLQSKGMWYWMRADRPSQLSDPKGWRKWEEMRDQAIGVIRSQLSPELRSISLDSEDPQTILQAIKDRYGKSSFATRHNALQSFLLVKQESSESIATFIACARPQAIEGSLP